MLLHNGKTLTLNDDNTSQLTSVPRNLSANMHSVSADRNCLRYVELRLSIKSFCTTFKMGGIAGLFKNSLELHITNGDAVLKN